MVVFLPSWIELRGAHKTMKNTQGEGGGGQAAPHRNTRRAFIYYPIILYS